MADTLEQIASEVTSAASNEFNPEVHVAKEGQPSYTKGGKFRKKKKDANQSEVDIAEDAPPNAAYSEMGDVMATTVTSGFTMLLGDEWIPIPQETQAMSMAWAKYFEKTGMTEFSPLTMLFLIHAGYAGRRLYMPQTKGRIARAIDWIKTRVLRRYARTNSGYDIKRENHASEESSAGISS